VPPAYVVALPPPAVSVIVFEQIMAFSSHLQMSSITQWRLLAMLSFTTFYRYKHSHANLTFADTYRELDSFPRVPRTPL